MPNCSQFSEQREGSDKEDFLGIGTGQTEKRDRAMEGPGHRWLADAWLTTGRSEINAPPAANAGQPKDSIALITALAHRRPQTMRCADEMIVFRQSRAHFCG